MILSTGKNLKTIGKQNIENVLKLLMVEKSLSRKELAQRLGLSKMTITNIVNQLKEKGYLFEQRMERVTVCNGPTPTAVSIVPKSLIAVGVHISSTVITVQEVDIVDGVLYEKQAAVDNMDSNQQLVKLVRDMIEAVLNERPEYRKNVVGIGVTYSGIVDAEKGKISFSVNQIEKEEINIRSSLEKRFSLPVILANEIQGAIIAELIFGGAVGPQKIYYVNAGERIRGGFVNNYLICHGSYGLSGEIGHITVKYDGPLCLCGSRGCYNLFAGLGVLLEKSSCHSLEELQLKIQERDPLALRIMEEYIQITTAVFANIVNLYDPSYLLVSGEITKLDSSIFRKIERLLNERIIYRKDRYVKIVISGIHVKANTIGAAMAVYGELFMNIG